MSDTLITLFSLIATLGTLSAGFIYTYYHHKLGVGSAPSSAAARRVMADEIKSLGFSAPGIVDFGSGTGGLVRALARAIPQAQVTGLELSPPANALAVLRTKLFGPRNARFLLKDFNAYDLSTTNVVVTYLTGNILAALSERLKTNLPKDAVVLCLNYQLPAQDWDVYKIIKTGNVIEPALYCHKAKGL